MMGRHRMETLEKGRKSSWVENQVLAKKNHVCQGHVNLRNFGGQRTDGGF